MRRLAPAALAFLTACAGRQSALDPAGTYAERIFDLWWIFLGVCATAWLLVVIFLLAAIFRRRRETTDRRLTIAVGTSIGATVVALFVLLFFSASTGASLSEAKEQPSVRIEVTAQQWWWHIVYDDPIPSQRFTSDNEIYFPVGRPVEFVLQSRDVIHSLWIPNMHGKRDLIPGMKSRFVMQADRPGNFEGQCAEFCGMQHAKMRLTVKAVPEAEFRAWADRQRQPARPPQTGAERKGVQVFMQAGCPLCHAITGTYAQGTFGPDLTHIGSRSMLAAGTIPNTPGHMAGWISDPQSIKPGNKMPPNILGGEELQSLLAYLRSLK